MIVSLTPGCSSAIFFAFYNISRVLFSFPLELAHSAACILARTNSKIYSLFRTSPKEIVSSFSFFYFLANLYPRISTYDAIPKKLGLFCTPLEKLIDVSLDISLIFFQESPVK
jgi:hypothetical protein